MPGKFAKRAMEKKSRCHNGVLLSSFELLAQISVKTIKKQIDVQ